MRGLEHGDGRHRFGRGVEREAQHAVRAQAVLNRDHVAVRREREAIEAQERGVGRRLEPAHRARREIDAQQAVGVIRDHQRAAARRDDDALQRHELRALGEHFQRRAARREPPDHRAAAVGEQHAAIRREREIAEHVGLLVAGSAHDGDHAAHRARLKVDFRERRGAVLLGREAAHRGHRRGRRPEHAAGLVHRESEDSEQLVALRREAPQRRLLVLRALRAHPHGAAVYIAKEKLPGLFAPRDAFDQARDLAQRKRDVALAARPGVGGELGEHGFEFRSLAQRGKILRLFHRRTQAERREPPERGERVVGPLVGELRRREVDEHPRKIRAERDGGFHFGKIGRDVLRLGGLRGFARERHRLRGHRRLGARSREERGGAESGEKDKERGAENFHGGGKRRTSGACARFPVARNR